MPRSVCIWDFASLSFGSLVTIGRILQLWKMRLSLELSFILLTVFSVVNAGGFYSFVETEVPLSGILKIISGVTKRVCVLKCRISQKCVFSAIKLEKEDCLHLNKINFSNGEETIAVNLIMETKTDLKVSGT